ncbi:hypothetical protein KY316_03500, partial [Candidatus Woesearchaeota archaeon]|nr:hypothetical protein [Candidatus Woesearchaeota archaeon]
DLKEKFNLDNPQIEIAEVGNVFLDANVVGEMIVNDLERFGSMRFKQIGHRMVENIMRAGALGVEIRMSGKIPSARAKSWRFYAGYLKKSGEASEVGVRKSIMSANLKSGTVGVLVMIMPPDLVLPDKVLILEDVKGEGAEAAEEKKEEKAEEGKKKKPAKKKKKKAAKKEEAAEEAKPEQAKEPEVHIEEVNPEDVEAVPEAEKAEDKPEEESQ